MSHQPEIICFLVLIFNPNFLVLILWSWSSNFQLKLLHLNLNYNSSAVLGFLLVGFYPASFSLVGGEKRPPFPIVLSTIPRGLSPFG
jgi:hypothetical protein